MRYLSLFKILLTPHCTYITVNVNLAATVSYKIPQGSRLTEMKLDLDIALDLVLRIQWGVQRI